MKTSKTLLGAAVLSIILLSVGSVNASIVDIDARSSAGSNVSLSAGDYVVSWVGTADGGAFDAWSAWSGVDYYGVDHWLNQILVTTSAGPFAHGTGSAPWYLTPGEALAAAQGATFHLSLATAEAVNFMVPDNIFGDNRGGVSLSVTTAPVPIPGAVWLLGSGLVGLIGARRKKKA